VLLATSSLTSATHFFFFSFLFTGREEKREGWGGRKELRGVASRFLILLLLHRSQKFYSLWKDVIRQKREEGGKKEKEGREGEEGARDA